MYGIGGELDEQVGETWRKRGGREGGRFLGLCWGWQQITSWKMGKSVFSRTCQLFIGSLLIYL